MMLMTFDYKKSCGSTSKRTFVPFVTPATMWGGLDVSEMSTEEQALYLTELEVVKQTYADSLKALQDKYELNHRYRQFKPENMANIKTEDI